MNWIRNAMLLECLNRKVDIHRIIFDQQDWARQGPHKSLSVLPGVYRQLDKKCGAQTGLRCGPDPAAQLFHELLNDCESSTRPFEIFLTHKPIKQTENAVVVLHIKTNSVIRDCDPITPFDDAA